MTMKKYIAPEMHMYEAQAQSLMAISILDDTNASKDADVLVKESTDWGIWTDDTDTEN